MELLVRNATPEDLPGILECENAAWPEGARADKETYIKRINTFQEGVFVAIQNNKILGVAVIEIIDGDKWLHNGFSWAEITDNGEIVKSHDPQGDCVYGVNLSIVPHSTGCNLVNVLLGAVIGFIRERKLVLGAFGGRLPGFQEYVARKGWMPDQITPQQVWDYIIGKKSAGRYNDPEVDIYLKSGLGLEVVRPLRNYFHDPESLNWGVLITWRNPECALSPQSLAHHILASAEV